MTRVLSLLVMPTARMATAYLPLRYMDRLFLGQTPAAGFMAGSFQQLPRKHSSTHNVNPFGNFVFDGPASVTIAPMNPQEYPDMDKCILRSDCDTSKWKVIVKDGLCSIESEEKSNTAESWTVKLPIQYGVEVRDAGRVSVSGMESRRVDIRAADDVTLTSVRAGQVAVTCAAAVRIQKLLLGNVTLDSQVVESAGARLQGQTVSVSARRCCHLSDIYAGQVSVRCESGDLRVGTVHGSCTISSAGAGLLTVGGVDGSVDLSAPLADVQCHLQRLQSDSALRCGGALRLTLSPAAACRLEVRGPPPDLDPRLRPSRAGPPGATTWRLGGAACDDSTPRLLLETARPATVTVQDWAESVTAGWR